MTVGLEADQDSNKIIVPNPEKFPDFQGMIKYIHSKGLKFGLYTVMLELIHVHVALDLLAMWRLMPTLTLSGMWTTSNTIVAMTEMSQLKSAILRCVMLSIKPDVLSSIPCAMEIEKM